MCVVVMSLHTKCIYWSFLHFILPEVGWGFDPTSLPFVTCPRPLDQTFLFHQWPSFPLCFLFLSVHFDADYSHAIWLRGNHWKYFVICWSVSGVARETVIVSNHVLKGVEKLLLCWSVSSFYKHLLRTMTVIFEIVREQKIQQRAAVAYAFF